jgi:hypothetical protein
VGMYLGYTRWVPVSHSKNHPTLVLTIYMHLTHPGSTHYITYLPINLPTYRFTFCGEFLPFCEKIQNNLPKICDNCLEYENVFQILYFHILNIAKFV